MTKYIPLEEVKKAIESCGQLPCIQDEYDLFLIRDKFDNLPTIDPIATIDEMIEEYNKGICCYEHEKYLKDGSISALEELKSRLSLTQK